MTTSGEREAVFQSLRKTLKQHERQLDVKADSPDLKISTERWQRF